MGYQRNENISCLWRCQNQTHQFEKGPKSNTSIWERAIITHIKIKQMPHERKVPKFHNLGIPLNCLNMRNYLFKYPQLFFVQIHVIFLIYTQKCVWYTRMLKKSNKPYIVDLQSLLRNCVELFLELIMIMYLNTIIIIIVQNWHKNYKLVFVREVGLSCFIVTFNYFSVISWRSVLLLEETGVHWENPPTCRKSLTKFIT